jgi:hypothetical protein
MGLKMFSSQILPNGKLSTWLGKLDEELERKKRKQ